MKLQEVTLKEYKSAQLLNESWTMLTEQQQVYMGRWENTVWPLLEQYMAVMEAELTADQIQQVFQNAEKISIEGGENMTALGKTGKVTSELSSKIGDEVKKLALAAQKTGPIKNIDQQFDKLRTKIAAGVKQMPGGNKILAGVDKWKDFAKENPGKSAFIISAMTTILGFASAGMVPGAAIGLFLRVANQTIQGDKLSTAFGKGLKTAAIGAVAGAIGGVIADGDFDFGDADFDGDAAEFSADTDFSDVDVDLSNVSEDQFKEMFANKLADEQFAKWGDAGSMNDAMLEKMADNVEISGNYPDDFQATLNGSVVQGNTYMTADEVAEYNKIVQSNGGGTQGAFSKEAQDYVNDIRGEGPTGATDTGAGNDIPDDAATTGKNYSSAEAAKSAAERTEKWSTSVSDEAVVDNGDGTFSVLEKNPENVDSVNKAAGVGSKLDTDAGSADPRQSAEWDDMQDFDKAYELRMNVDAEDWTPEDFDIVKADGDMNPRLAAEYFAVRPDAVMDYSGGDISKTEDFLKQMIGDDAWENASRQDKQWAIDWLKTNAYGTPTGESLEEQLWDELALYEAGALSGVMKMANNAADKIADVASKGIKRAGTELGQQVTAAKLNRAWKKMGSPTDTASIANLLSNQGMSDEQIGLVAKDNNIDLTRKSVGQGEVDIQALAAQIKKLGIADAVKQALMPKRKASPTS